MIAKPTLWTVPGNDGRHDVKIYLRQNGKKKYKSTGVKVFPKDWDEAKGQVKRTEPLAAPMNGRIERMRIELATHLLDGGQLRSLGKNSSGSFLEWLQQLIKEIKEGVNGLKGYNNYASLLYRIQEWMERHDRDDLLFEEINMDWYFSFRDFLLQHGDCTLEGGFSKHIQFVKATMNKARDRGLHNYAGHEHKDFKKYKKTDSGKIYLKQEEVDAIASLDLSSNLPLERERDRFLLSFYLLLRYGDSTNIRREHFNERNGRLYYTNIAQKTAQASSAPVKPLVKDILIKYDYQMNFGANAMANRYIKQIAAMAGINQIVSENGRKGPKSQFITTHTARRSAATLLRLDGMALPILQQLGGWQKLSSLETYLRNTSIETAVTVADHPFFS